MNTDGFKIIAVIVSGLAVIGLYLIASALIQPTNDSVVAKSSANQHEDYPESVVEDLKMYRCDKKGEVDGSIVERCTLVLTLASDKSEMMLNATIKEDVIHYNDTPLKIGDTVTYYQGGHVLSPKPDPSAIITINGVAVEHE